MTTKQTIIFAIIAAVLISLFLIVIIAFIVEKEQAACEKIIEEGKECSSIEKFFYVSHALNTTSDSMLSMLEKQGGVK